MANITCFFFRFFPCFFQYICFFFNILVFSCFFPVISEFLVLLLPAGAFCCPQGPFFHFFDAFSLFFEFFFTFLWFFDVFCVFSHLFHYFLTFFFQLSYLKMAANHNKDLSMPTMIHDCVKRLVLQTRMNSGFRHSFGDKVLRSLLWLAAILR